MKLLCILLALLMTLLGACGQEAADDEVVGTPVPQVEAGEAYATEIERLTIDFAAAYFGDDIEAMKDLLSDDYSCGIIDTYPKNKDKVVIVAIKGLEQAAKDYAAAGQCVMSVEFRENETADSYSYLTIEMQQGEDGPEVYFYGLEG